MSAARSLLVIAPEPMQDAKVGGAAVVLERGKAVPVPPIPRDSEPRITITILSGANAGQVVAVGGGTFVIGNAADADVVVHDAGVSDHHVRVALTADGMFYAEDIGSSGGTFLRTGRIGLALIRTGDRLQIGPSLQVGFEVDQSIGTATCGRATLSSVRGPPTRAYRRRFLADRLWTAIAEARAHATQVSILLIDVDGLAEVDDSFGPLASDRATCTIEECILAELRSHDTLVRAGDRYVVLAVETGLTEAVHLGEQIRRAIEGLVLIADGRQVGVTASIGVSALAEVSTTDDASYAFLRLAGNRMHRAKALGRNRVCAFDEGCPRPK